MNQEHRQCLICHSDLLRPVRGYERHHLVQCRNCRFVFISKIPAPEELTAFYHHYGSQTALSPITVVRYQELLDRFAPYRKTNRILDVGCGVGHFLGVAQERKWEVYGNEVALDAIQECVRHGIHVQAGPLDANPWDAETFDVITLFEVMEHIHNPVDELRQMHRILRPGGLLYCTTPNFNSLLRYWLKADFNVIHYPEHLSYYTPRTLNYLFEQNGFRAVGVRTTGFSFSRLRDSRPIASAHPQAGAPTNVSPDEQVRGAIEANPLLRFGKALGNGVLTATQSGMTVKGFFEKQ